MTGNTVVSDYKHTAVDGGGDIALEATHLIAKVRKHIEEDRCRCCRRALEND
jgi:hypothetical protein